MSGEEGNGEKTNPPIRDQSIAIEGWVFGGEQGCELRCRTCSRVGDAQSNVESLRYVAKET